MTRSTDCATSPPSWITRSATNSISTSPSSTMRRSDATNWPWASTCCAVPCCISMPKARCWRSALARAATCPTIPNQPSIASCSSILPIRCCCRRARRWPRRQHKPNPNSRVCKPIVRSSPFPTIPSTPSWTPSVCAATTILCRSSMRWSASANPAGRCCCWNMGDPRRGISSRSIWISMRNATPRIGDASGIAIWIGCWRNRTWWWTRWIRGISGRRIT
mmetsp:Transcript_11031/g.30463  ORF Transcript_11031/g.30463 Transcript_11031/m.30463 type:complete len:220 (+) Transcript_11031:68-727(+)